MYVCMYVCIYIYIYMYSGQNPYAVAQDFIWANDLPQDHLEQIANFIDKNAAAITLGTYKHV